MRGDGLAQPVFSTYAVGAAPPRRSRAGASGRNVAFPVTLALGSVSALAVVFAWSETERAADSDPITERRAPLIDQHPGRQRGSSAIEPGFSFETSRSRSTEHSTAGSVESPGPAVQARTMLRADHAASMPARAIVAPTAGKFQAQAPAHRCLSNCGAVNADLAAGGSRSDVVEVDQQPLEAAAGFLADAAATPDILNSIEKATQPPLVDRVASEVLEGALGIEVEPVSLVPADEVAATGADAIAVAGLQTDMAASGANVGLEADDRGHFDTAPVERRDTPATEAVEESHRKEPSDAIALHLRRIGERYSSGPVSEPTIATEKIEQGSDRSATGPGTKASLASVAMPAASGGVIIRDDSLIAIQLGQLVSLLEDQLDRPLFVWMKSSAAAAKFATLDTLAAAGIRAEYDAQREQIVLSVEDDWDWTAVSRSSPTPLSAPLRPDRGSRRSH